MDARDIVDDFLRELLGSTAPIDDAPIDAPPSYNATVGLTLDSETTQGLLEDAIERVGTSAQDIEIAFGDISLALAKTVKIAQDARRSEEFHRMGLFKENWDDAQNKYVEQVRESRRIAGHVRAIALDFARDFPDVQVSNDATCLWEEKKQETAQYRQELENDKENARNLTTGFVDLQADVMAFGHDINEYVEQRSGEVAAEARKPLDVMQRVRNELDLVSHMFYQVVQPNGTLESEPREPVDAAQVMDEISTSVTALQHATDSLQKKLAHFALIWSTIYSELSVIEKELELVSTSKTKIRFEKRMKTASVAYKTLELALHSYETRVHIQQHGEETE